MKNKKVFIGLLALISGLCRAVSDQTLYEALKETILTRNFITCRYMGSIINAETLAEADSFLRSPRMRHNPNDLDAAIIRRAALKHKKIHNSGSNRPDQEEKIKSLSEELPRVQSSELEKKDPNFGIGVISIFPDKYGNKKVEVTSRFRVLDGDADKNSPFFKRYIYDPELSSPFYQFRISPCTKCKPYGDKGLMDCTTKIDVDPALAILQDLIVEKGFDKDAKKN